MIPQSALGADLGCRVIEVDKRWILSFAAGIGSAAPIYLDDARPGGIVAPATFTVALEWPTLMSTAYLGAIGRDETSAFDDLVHGFQDSRFHRPIRPGDRLAVSGRIVGVQQTRAGTLVTTRIATVDAADGAPVAEGWFGALYRGVETDGPGGCVAELPALRAERGVPHAITRQTIGIPRGQAHIYTECARIWNPLHTERAFALAAGLPDIILHGTCTWAMALQRLIDRHRADRPMPLLRAATRFTRMVIPGTTVVLEHAPPDRDGFIAFAVQNDAAEIALGHALAVLA
nr:MaoC/PaaZ C-terminal domain-containing protein [uncultured Rhodopila sp.]